MICIQRPCGDGCQNLSTALSRTHTQTDGHQNGLTVCGVRDIRGTNANLVTPVLNTAIDGSIFGFRTIRITQIDSRVAGSNRCTIRDQNRVGFVGRLFE